MGKTYRDMQREKRDRFNDRFERNEDTGSFKLTSLGCMKRWEGSREEELTVIDNRIENRTQSRCDQEEWMTNARVKSLMAEGYMPGQFQSLEDFVEEHKDMFEEDGIKVTINGRRIA